MASKDVYLNFGADTGALEAALARSQASIRATTAEMRSLAAQMQKTGASVDSEAGQRLASLGQKLGEAKGAAASTRAEIGKLSEVVEGIGGGGHGAGAGLGFYAREAHALMDELTSGRVHQAQGTFANLAFTFAQAHTAMLPLAGAALAAAAAIGYLVYEALAFKNASSELAAQEVINQFHGMGQAADEVVAAISKAASTSYSEAEKFAAPFLALGPGGEQIAKLASYYLPLYVKAGVDAEKAGEDLAKNFRDLSTAGNNYVHLTAGLSAATISQYDASVRAGDAVKAYSIILEAMRVRLEEGRQALQSETSDLGIFAENMAIGQAAVDGLNMAQDVAAERAKRVSEAIRTQGQAISGLRSEAEREFSGSKVVDAQKAASADKIIAKTNAESEKVKTLKADYDQLVQQLGTYDKSTEAGMVKVRENWAAQKKIQDELRQAQERDAGGLIPQSAFDRAQHQIKELENSFKGLKSEELTKEVQILGLTKLGNKVPDDTKEGQQFNDEIAAKKKAAAAAGSDEYIKGEELKTIAAGNGVNERSALARKEAAEKARLYGRGSPEELASRVGLAQAQRAAGDKVRADQAASLDQQIADLRNNTEQKVKQYADDVKNHQKSAREGAAGAIAELQREAAAVRAFFEQKKSLAQTTSDELRTIDRQEAEAARQIADQMKQEQRRANDEQVKAWKDAADQISGIINSQVDGLLRGTTSVQQAFKNMAASMIEHLIQVGIQMAVETVLLDALKIASGGTIGGGGGILASAAGLLGFAEGTPYVRQSGLAVIHQGEAIIPAAQNPYAQATPGFSGAGGAGMGGDMHIHGHYHDYGGNRGRSAQTPKEMANELYKNIKGDRNFRNLPHLAR